MLRKTIIELMRIRPRRKQRIEPTADGIRCFGTKEGGVLTVMWDSIFEIEGLKRDRITTDLICLIIKYPGEEQIMEIEINEDIEGFDDVVKELERRKFL